MLTQKIIGTETKTVKYHGDVKFLIFECNNCGRHFSKVESYSRKQLKIHKNACCFCTPDCRNDYFNKILLEKTRNFKQVTDDGAKHEKSAAPAAAEAPPVQEEEQAPPPADPASEEKPRVVVAPSLETLSASSEEPEALDTQSSSETPSPSAPKKKESSFFGWLNKVLEG